MDADCKRVLFAIGRLCNWDINISVPNDRILLHALNREGMSENLFNLCIEELIKFRHIRENKNKLKITPKGYDYGYPKRFEPLDDPEE